jgi:flagellar protein FlbD
MIELHRLSTRDEPLHLNPDLIQVVEAHPDTVITLTTGVKILVKESPAELAELVRRWRSSILSRALDEAPGRPHVRRRADGMILISGAAAPPPPEDPPARADHSGR